jgi:hypothetical protein
MPIRPEEDDRDERKHVFALTDELLNLIESDQGYFHVSDGETFATIEEFFERMRGRLKCGQSAVRKMRAFLKKHNQL